MTYVYLTCTDSLLDPELYQRAYESLPAHRKLKIDRLRFDRDKRLSVGVWCLLRYGMAQKGIDCTGLSLSLGPGGKPHFAQLPGLRFSLSHSGSLALCAISTQEVGCDIQKSASGYQKIAGRFFTPEENAQLSQAAEEEAKILFDRMWVLKESFLKLTGQGLSLPLNRFSLDLTRDPIAITQDLYPAGSLFCQECCLPEGYRCACWALEPDFSPLQTVDLADILP